MSSLADRIRGVVSAGGPRPPVASHPATETNRSGGAQPAIASALSSLGGRWMDGCYVVERDWAPAAAHGRDRVGDLAATLHASMDDAALLAGGTKPRPPLTFFDLETTGLNGGAGTLAFLVGCGWFDGDRFVTRQFLMTSFASERPMLQLLARELANVGALVSFNGKSFDAPMLETRFLFHRLDWTGRELAHIDVLHPARQFWKRDDCSLTALERQLIGHRRSGDIPGIEIPARYFQFIRSGDAAPLAPVLQHNRLDLLSLAALAVRLLDLARRGPDAARNAREAIALGRVYARAGFDDRAYDAFARALSLSRAPARAFDAVRIDALRALAHTCRRLRRFEESARRWRELLEIRGCPPPVAGEAAEALAIHHEHRVKDLQTARRYAATLVPLTPRQTNAIGWRISRLDRKLAARPAVDLLDSL